MRGWTFLFLLGLSFQAFAAGVATQLTESFTSRDHLANSTALWNHATGAVTPTLLVKGWKTIILPGPPATLSAPQDSPIDVGDGSLGDFDSTTWSRFAISINSTGKIITIDTNIYPILKFKNFVLDVGWTLAPTGSNPLVIYVLGDMTVNGVINCSGRNGTPSVFWSAAVR